MIKCESIKNCRICNSTNLVEAIHLGDQYLSSVFPENLDYRQTEKKYPLNSVMCNDCKLIQLSHSFCLDSMYKNYPYRSNLGNMKAALKDVANSIVEYVEPKEDDLILDIGGNDGTTLSYFQEYNCDLMCIDAAQAEAVFCHPKFKNIQNTYFNREVFEKYSSKKAKIAISTAMFYHLDKPVDFLREVSDCLDNDGIYVVQMAYLLDELKGSLIDNRCFKPDTKILGDKNLSIADTQIGDLVFDYSGNLTQVVKKFENEYSGKLIKIKPFYLDAITCTPEHPIYIIKKNKEEPEWVEAKNVKKDDCVLVPKLKPTWENLKLDLSKYNMLESRGYRRGLKELEITPEFAWLMGLYVAEGHIDGKWNNLHVHFTLNINEMEYYGKIKDIVSRVLNGKTRCYKRPNNNSMGVSFTCCALGRAFHEWFGKNARTKQIPQFILEAPLEIKKEFLKGLFDGDGYIKNNQVHLHSASKLLIYQTQLLVASANGMLGFSYCKPSPPRQKKDGSWIRGGDSWMLRGRNQNLSKIFDFEWQGVFKPARKYNDIGDYLSVRVDRIEEEDYSGKVYNIETESNTYLASNSIVHNCHEHATYYTLNTLKKVVEQTDLEIFDVTRNSLYGGSFRIFLKKKTCNKYPTNKRVWERLEDEDRYGMQYLQTYKNFENNWNEIGQRIKKTIKSYKNVWILAAPTKFSTILQNLELTNKDITAAAEIFDWKIGKYIIGCDIPIRSELALRKSRPDLIVIGLYGFAKELIIKNSDLLEKGCKFLIPLPTPLVIDKSNIDKYLLGQTD